MDKRKKQDILTSYWNYIFNLQLFYICMSEFGIIFEGEIVATTTDGEV